jgi:hypothetical protein
MAGGVREERDRLVAVLGPLALAVEHVGGHLRSRTLRKAGDRYRDCKI